MRLVLLIIATVLLCQSTWGLNFEITRQNEVVPVKPLSQQEYVNLKAKYEREHPAEMLRDTRHKNVSQKVCGVEALSHMIKEKENQKNKGYLSSLLPLSWLQQSFFSNSDTSQSTCKRDTVCDDPLVRDEDTTLGEIKTIDLEILIERGTPLEASAETVIPIVVTELNNAFDSAGFRFNSRIVYWGPMTHNGAPVASWETNMECDTTKPLPCFADVPVVNNIFSERGGYLKANTAVILIANIQLSEMGTLLGYAYVCILSCHLYEH